jgi:hypothetical protein
MPVEHPFLFTPELVRAISVCFTTDNPSTLNKNILSRFSVQSGNKFYLTNTTFQGLTPVAKENFSLPVEPKQ